MKFNIDVSDLSPGDIIEQSQCEAIIGFSRDSDKYEYQFAVMQLAEHVAHELRKGGKHFTVVTENGSVAVLTHEQASRYNAARFDGAIAKMRRCNRRLIAVNVGVLTVEAKADHLKNIQRQASVLQLIGRRKPELVPEPARRVVVKR